ncbi:flagellar basal body rod protein FlgC [Frigidibacter sp. MR17.24]|uniref:flagellar basal body rod protein FlgC n=1 Tax=Frigidibacter sp. MR17.24 TaxID=3127345 RepID=UPI003012FBAF
MADFGDSMGISASGMRAQAMRMRIVSENVANADTPGYHRKLVTFRPEDRDQPGAVEIGRVTLDPSEPERILDPGHPLADAQGYRLSSNVEAVIEMADAREAQRSYEANLRMFDQARQMSARLLELLRR